VCHVDLVICVDCFYQPEHYPALATTLSDLAAPALLVWRERGRAEDAMLQLLTGRGFGIELLEPPPSLSASRDSGLRLAMAQPPASYKGSSCSGPATPL